MVLATLGGYALQSWAGLHDAGEFGFLAGLVGALLVPTGKRSCPIPQR